MFISLEKVLAGSGSEPLWPVSLKDSQALVQVKRGNSAKIDLGSRTLVVDKGIELLPPEVDVALPSITIEATGVGNNLDLNDIYIIGTQSDGVNIFCEVY